MSARDTQRSRVYAAEGFVRTLFDRAAQHDSRTIDFFGASLTLPPEARFAAVESVQRYVNQVLAMPGVAEIRREPGPLRVRVRRAATAAHYERRDGAGVIAVPAGMGAEWALREWVVLHEIAHHLCRPAAPAHGSEFVSTFCALATVVMGPEAGHVLRVVYAKEGAH